MPTSAAVPYISEKFGLLSISKEIVQGIPNWQFTSTTGGSTTAIAVATTDGKTHDNQIDNTDGNTVFEVNAGVLVADYFKGAQVYWLSTTATAALQGKVYDITGFASTGGTATFTVSAMASAAANNDLFYVFWPQPASNISINFAVENLPRDFVRQTLDMPASLKGLKTCDGSFDVEIPGLVATSADGSAAGVDRHSAMCSVIGTRSAGNAEAIIAGTLGVSTFTVTLASEFTVGDYVLINNEVRRVTVVDTGSTPDELTVSPPLSNAPIATDLVYAGEVWNPDETGHQTLTILHLKDDRLLEIRGAACSLKTSNEFGQFNKFTCDFNAAYIDSTQAQTGWDITDAFTEMDGSQTSKKPPVFKDCAARHFGLVQLEVASWEMDFGHERNEHRYSCSHSFSIQGRAATAAVNFKDTTVLPKETWEVSGTQDELMLTVGNSAGDCLAVGGNAQVQDVANANNNEFQDWNANFAFVDDQTDAAQPKKPKLVRF